MKYSDITLNPLLIKFLKSKGILRKFKKYLLKDIERNSNDFNPAVKIANNNYHIISSILSAFFWCETTDGGVYWNDINYSWREYCELHKDKEN